MVEVAGPPPTLHGHNPHNPGTRSLPGTAHVDVRSGIAKRCLTDNSLPHRLCLVGALVLLYGQQASAIARLRRSDVTSASGLVSIRLGRDAVVLDEPLATIAAELAAAAVPDAQPRGIARAFNAEGDGWLFPGRGPGKPLGEDALRQDLTNCRSGLDPAGTPPCSPLPGTYPDGPVRPSRRWLQYRRTMARLRRRRVRHLRLSWSLLRRRSSSRSRSVPATGSWVRHTWAGAGQVGDMTTLQSQREERFRALFADAYGDLIRFAQRRVHPTHAEDVVAEAFLVAWRRLDDAPSSHGDLRAWLFGITRNCLLNARRGQDRRGALAVRLAEFATSQAQDGGPDPDLISRRIDLASAWSCLSVGEQEVLALTVFEDLTSPQAARVIGISSAAYRLRLMRARREPVSYTHLT